MNKGQISLAIALIVLLVIIIVIGLLFVFVLNQPGHTPAYGDQAAYADWCVPGGSEYYEGMYAVVEGMVNFQGQELCRASLAHAGETGYMYFNEDSSVWYVTDAFGNILGSYLDSPDSDEDVATRPSTGGGSSEVCLEHGELMDFVNGVKYEDEDVWPDCDLEETPFSAGQGMAGGAGLRSCNSLGIINAGTKDPSAVTMDDVYAGAMELNPTAAVGNTYAVELRDGNYAALEVNSVSSDQMTVCFDWAMVGGAMQGTASGDSGSGQDQDTDCITGYCQCGDGVAVENCPDSGIFNAAPVIAGYYCGAVTYKGQTACKISVPVTDQGGFCMYVSPIVEDIVHASGFSTLPDGTEVDDPMMYNYCGDPISFDDL